MGVGFIRKTAEPFKKARDQALLRLGTPDLFSKKTSCASRTYSAEMHRDVQLSPGDELIVRRNGGDVVGQKGTQAVVTLDDPPTEILSALEKSSGVALAHVQQVYDLADTVDLTLC